MRANILPANLSVVRMTFMRLILAACVVVGASMSAAVSSRSVAAEGEGLFRPTVFALANGLDVVVISDHRAPVVTHMVWYRVGAADDPSGKSGIAHFLEHLMFKGTATVPAGVFSKTVARLGGRENAFTSYDYTAYHQTIAADHLETMMRLEADRMTNLVLAESDVVTERDVILEERRQRIDNNPGALLGEQMGAAQFLAHPYGRSVIGWENEIAHLGRDDAMAFYRSWYAPNNAILVVAGDVTAARVRQLAEQYYGTIPKRDLPQRVRPTEPRQIAPRSVALRDPRVSQPSWRRTYLAPSRTSEGRADAIPLQVLAEILSGTTGRLYESLVIERRIAAGAGAWYDGTALDLTTFGIYASPLPGGDLDRIEEAIDGEIARLLADGVTDEELDRAKAGMMARVVYARDSLATGARIFGGALAVGRPAEEIEAWPERVGAVTAEEVMTAARKVLDDRRSVTGRLLVGRQG
jgi:zinc protease